MTAEACVDNIRIVNDELSATQTVIRRRTTHDDTEVLVVADDELSTTSLDLPDPEPNPGPDPSPNPDRGDPEPFNLSNDVYSLMFRSDVRSRTFLFGLCVFAFQVIILVLCVINLVSASIVGNLLHVPARVPRVVTAAQVLALIVASLQNDVLCSLDSFHADFGNNRKLYAKWYFTNFLRFLEGICVMTVALIFIVQADDVLGLFLDFAAVAFVSKLDDFAFFLADRGFVPIQGIGTETKEVKNMTIRTKSTIKLCGSCITTSPRTLLRTVYVVILMTLYGTYAVIFIKQRIGTYYWLKCNAFEIKFSNEYSYDYFNSDECKKNCPPAWKNRTDPAPIFYSSYNGVYSLDHTNAGGVVLENGRPVYYQRDRNDNLMGKIHYCKKTGSWAFTIPEVSKGMDANDCSCLAMSPKTDALFLEDIGGSDWTVFTGIVENTSLDITCVNCHNKITSKDDKDASCSFNGLCRDERCDCLDDWTGPRCDACAACTEFELLVKEKENNDTALMSLNSIVFARLDDHRVPPAGNIKVYSVYGHPVYYYGSHTTGAAVVIIYSGSQYWIKNVTNTCEDKHLVLCLDTFHSTSWKTANEPIYVSEVTTRPIHSELKWSKFNLTRYKGLEDALPFEIKCRNQAQRKTCEFLF